MALVSSCLCCSLLTASIMAGLTSAFLYITAFSLEMWWIVEAKGKLRGQCNI